jgi:hypothetical protein
MKTKTFILIAAMILMSLIANAQRGHGGGHGGWHGGGNYSHGNYGHYNGGYHYNGWRGGYFWGGIIRPVFLDPRIIYQPHRVWIEGRWTYDQYGQPYWIEGHWQMVY